MKLANNLFCDGLDDNEADDDDGTVAPRPLPFQHQEPSLLLCRFVTYVNR
jgi:hypothetical protein